MIIILPNNAEFDTELTFDNQAQDCQDYFFDVMNTSEPTTVVDSFNRPLKQTWEVLSIGFQVARITEYATQSGDWNFKNQYHKTTRKVWHEDKEFQIIMHSLQLAKLTKDYPDFVYSEGQKRETYIEGDYIYQYTDIVLPEHRVILESYGIIINKRD
jgi:hypothetical protein